MQRNGNPADAPETERYLPNGTQKKGLPPNRSNQEASLRYRWFPVKERGHDYGSSCGRYSRLYQANTCTG